ncbi:MAG: phage holin family protein [Deferribacteres bacterium]|nr:phage holin family protein [candidate division KSB1 bacterium]MCB9503699.1 phage holin family protein [Deferribacteres bacterium]
MPAEKSSITASIVHLWATLLEGMQYRFELFAIEFGEEKRRFLSILVAIIVAVMAVFFGFFMLNLALLLMFWRMNTILAFAFAGFYLFLAVLLIIYVRSKIVNSPKPFAASMAEFKKDQDFFGAKNE